MLTIERELEAIGQWKAVVYNSCGDEYLATIAQPWFEDIGPSRAMQYGVLGLNELGGVGVVYQVLNCYYRWRHLEDEGTGFTSLADTFRDALGYAVLLGVVTVTPSETLDNWDGLWEANDPDKDHEVVNSLTHMEARVEYSFRLAAGMYNVTAERLKDAG